MSDDDTDNQPDSSNPEKVVARLQRRRRSYLFRTMQGVVAILVLLVAVAIFLIATVPGGRMLALIVNRMGTNAVQGLEITDLSGITSGDTRIGELTLSDDKGERWLVLKGVAIDWSPMALFSSGLAIDALRIEHVELAKLPENEPPANPATSSAFTLPLNINIKQLSLPDILLGEKVAGRAARLKVDGMAKVDTQFSDSAADLQVTRIDGVGGEASLQANVNLPENRFDLDFNLSEPAGGVLANLARLPQDESVAIAAKSQGTLADWTLAVNGDIDGKQAASADLAVQSGDLGRQFDLTARGAVGRFLPPQLAGLFTGDTDLQLTGLVEPEQAGVQIDAFTLESSSLHGEGRGRIGREGALSLKLDAAAKGDSARISLGEGAQAVAIALKSFDIAVDGTAEQARLRVSGQLPSITTSDLSVESVSVQADFADVNTKTRTGTGTVSIDAASAGSANEILARVLAGAIKINADVSVGEGLTVSTKDMLVQSATTSLRLSGDFDVNAVTGAGKLEAQLKSAVVSPKLAEIAGPDVSASASFTLGEAGAVALTDFNVSAANLSAKGEASLDVEKVLVATLTAALPDLSRLDSRATGALVLSASANGALARPEFTLKVDGTDLVLEGKPVEGLSLTASGVADPDAPRADVELAGSYRGKPITGKATLKNENGRNLISPLRIDIEGNHLEGALELDAAFRPLGSIKLDFPDIAAVSALVLSPVGGLASGTLDFSVDGEKPLLSVDLDVARLSGEGFAVSDARIEAKITDYLASAEVAGSAGVKRIDAGKTAISNIVANFTQDAGWTRFDGGAQADGSPVSVKGRVRVADGKTELELETAKVSYQGVPVSLNAPARVSVVNGVAEIGQLSLSPGGGSVDISGSAGKQLDLAIKMSGVPLSVVNKFAPGAGLAGTISGNAKVSGTASAPVVKYDLAAAGFQAAAMSSVTRQTLAISASGNYAGDKVAFDAAVKDGSGLTLDASGSVGLAGSKAMSIKANGTAPFSLLSPVLAAQGMVLDGAASVNLSISGSTASPSVSGTVTTSNARFIDTGSGVTINDISADLVLDRQTVRIRSFKGTLAGGGAITGAGTVGLDGNAGYPGDLTLKVARGRYADGRLVATHFDADLTLKGPLLSTPVLGGVLKLDETTITVPKSLPGSIAQLDVQHENAGKAVNAQAQRLEDRGSGSSGGGIGLDMRIDAPNRIYVRGRGMDVELGGSLTLKGTTGAPIASGGFDLRRGRLEVLGKRLTFDRGKLTFTGSAIPTLDFAATNSTSGGTVTVLVTGPATAPVINFTSSDGLPEDEAMAQLVFGQSLSNLSALQIAQLAQAAAELTGVVSGGGLFDSLRKATGVDNIDVRTDSETGDTSVAVGKYLNDRTYIAIEKGASAGSGKARIDLNIGKGVKLRGEATSEGSTSGGIFYERDY